VKSCGYRRCQAKDHQRLKTKDQRLKTKDQRLTTRSRIKPKTKD